MGIYSATGELLLANGIGGTGEETASGVSVDENGQAMVVGGFTGTSDLGNGPVSSSSASEDGFATILSSNASPLPVELVAFEAQTNGPAVQLRWTTASETNNLGFVVQRRVQNRWLDASEMIAGRGTSTERSSYAYELAGVTAGRHTFRLKQVDTDGTVAYSAALNVDVRLGRSLRATLLAGTRVRIETDEAQRVQLQVFDVLGRSVHSETVDVDGTVTFALPSALSAGKYFVRVVVGDKAEVLPFVAY